MCNLDVFMCILQTEHIDLDDQYDVCDVTELRTLTPAINISDSSQVIVTDCFPRFCSHFFPIFLSLISCLSWLLILVCRSSLPYNFL